MPTRHELVSLLKKAATVLSNQPFNPFAQDLRDLRDEIKAMLKRDEDAQAERMHSAHVIEVPPRNPFPVTP